MTIVKKILHYSFLLLVGFQLKAQTDENKQYFYFDKINFTIGYPGHIFDAPNFGVHLGVHPSYHLGQIVSVEAQVSGSYAQFERDANLFGHNGGYISNFNLMIGPRIYLLKEHRKVRPYFNAYMGFGYSMTREYGSDNVAYEFTDSQGTISLGAYVEVKEKFVAGLGFEGPEAAIVVKVGYVLKIKH
jgi:hypothetical protein